MRKGFGDCSCGIKGKRLNINWKYFLGDFMY